MPQKKISPDALSQTWVHSHEEDSDAEMTFRPSSYKFPPSRGRSSLTLEPDGTLIDSGPGPVDRTVAAKGQWELQQGKQPVLHLRPAGQSPRALQIVSATKDKLVVKK